MVSLGAAGRHALVVRPGGSLAGKLLAHRLPRLPKGYRWRRLGKRSVSKRIAGQIAGWAGWLVAGRRCQAALTQRSLASALDGLRAGSRAGKPAR